VGREVECAVDEQPRLPLDAPAEIGLNICNLARS
jgi:hypothetical protein